MKPRASKWTAMKWAAMSLGFAGNTPAAPRGDAVYFVICLVNRHSRSAASEYHRQ
jgi:hypothetical protein